jgi:hypothetical protein
MHQQKESNSINTSLFGCEKVCQIKMQTPSTYSPLGENFTIKAEAASSDSPERMNSWTPSITRTHRATLAIEEDEASAETNTKQACA